jgi:RecA-family ATPase
VVLVSAEEPEREVRRRLWLHGERDGYGFADLSDLHQWFPGDDHDTVFAVPDRTGIMRPTQLMNSLAAAIEGAAPVLVVVDNVAATFAGNQNDRVMVRSYVNIWRAIARGPSNPAVLLLDHPSLSGLTNGSGRGGNMDWRNAVRSALYLRPADDKAEADRGVRILETAKSNYGPAGNPLRLQWGEGGLQLEHAPSSLHRLAKDSECDETFLRLMDERNGQGRPVSDKSGRNYAPAVFAGLDNNGGFTRQAFAKAMERLFQTKTIALRNFRIDGKDRQCIDRAGEP